MHKQLMFVNGMNLSKITVLSGVHCKSALATKLGGRFLKPYKRRKLTPWTQNFFKNVESLHHGPKTSLKKLFGERKKGKKVYTSRFEHDKSALTVAVPTH